MWPNIEACRLLLFVMTCLIGLVGCQKRESTGQVGRNGYRLEKVDYQSRPRPEAIVAQFGRWNLDQVDGTPLPLEIPNVELRGNHAFAIEGTLTGGAASLTELEAHVECLLEVSGQMAVSQSASQVLTRKDGEFRFRVDFRLPPQRGKHTVRVGVVMQDEDDEATMIATGEIQVRP